MSKLLGMPCPHCRTRAQVRTVKDLSPTLRWVYFLCNNLACGHSWVATLEADRTISPSGMPDPRIALPIMARREVEAVHAALTQSPQRSIFDDDPCI